MSLCGVFLLAKPVGIRSSACVAALKRSLGRGVKVGHGGALDSTAQGLMVLLAGTATRVNDLVTGLPKLYEVEFKLGEERSTEDFSGETTFTGPVPANAAELIGDLIPGLLGARLQTPPDISAVWVKGKRAHEIARSGERPEITPRPVHISSVSGLQSLGEDAFRIAVRCKRGTYIRSIVRDIGRALGCGAYVISLTRRSIGGFALEAAASFNDLESRPHEMAERILPLSKLASNFYCYECSPQIAVDLKSGKTAPLAELQFLWPGKESPEGKAAVLGQGLFSYGEVLPEGLFRPLTNIFFEDKP